MGTRKQALPLGARKNFQTRLDHFKKVRRGGRKNQLLLRNGGSLVNHSIERARAHKHTRARTQSSAEKKSEGTNKGTLLEYHSFICPTFATPLCSARD